jgi:hypothetical protein
MASKTDNRREVGSLAPLLSILATGAIVFAIIPLALGESDYAIPAAVLFCVLAGFALTESLLSVRQKRHGAHEGATEQDGSLPLMTVEVADPFGGEDHAHEIGIHDYPPGHPARRVLREAAERTG